MRVPLPYAAYPLLAAVVAACSDGAAPGSSSTGDAGARSTVSSDAPRVFAEVGAEPTISIGGADAVGPAQLYGVVGVHIDRKSVVWERGEISQCGECLQSKYGFQEEDE